MISSGRSNSSTMHRGMAPPQGCRGGGVEGVGGTSQYRHRPECRHELYQHTALHGGACLLQGPGPCPDAATALPTAAAAWRTARPLRSFALIAPAKANDAMLCLRNRYAADFHQCPHGMLPLRGVSDLCAVSTTLASTACLQTAWAARIGCDECQTTPCTRCAWRCC
jgi:hypothetical protein